MITPRKNLLKKAIRRRNAKTVQFTSPTYFEPDDYDFSSDEDDQDDEFGQPVANVTITEPQEAGVDAVEADAPIVEPLKVNGVSEVKSVPEEGPQKTQQEPVEERRDGLEESRPADTRDESGKWLFTTTSTKIYRKVCY